MVTTPSSDKQKTVLLLSGGLDSAALLYILINQGREVLPVFVNYGQITAKAELVAVTALTEAMKCTLQTVTMDELALLGGGTLVDSSSRNEYFPFRNLMLLTVGAMKAVHSGASEVAIGVLADTSGQFPDCSEAFCLAFQHVVHYEAPNINVIAPLMYKKKAEVVAQGITMGLDVDLTFSCNRFADRHCWKCSSCYDRMEVLRAVSS